MEKVFVEILLWRYIIKYCHFSFFWYGLQKTILLKFYVKNQIESYTNNMFCQDLLSEKFVLEGIQTQLVLNNSDPYTHSEKKPIIFQ
jgi:hypothetical protein